MPRNLPSFNLPAAVEDNVEILILPPRRTFPTANAEHDGQTDTNGTDMIMKDGDEDLRKVRTSKDRETSDKDAMDDNADARSTTSTTSIDPALLFSPTISFRRTIDIADRDHIDVDGARIEAQHRRDSGLNQLPDVRREFHRAGWGRRRVKLIKSTPLPGSTHANKDCGGDYLVLLSKDDSRQDYDPDKFGPSEWNVSENGARAYGAIVLMRVTMTELKGEGKKLLFMPLPEGLDEQDGVLEQLATMAAEGTE